MAITPATADLWEDILSGGITSDAAACSAVDWFKYRTLNDLSAAHQFVVTDYASICAKNR